MNLEASELTIQISIYLGTVSLLSICGLENLINSSLPVVDIDCYVPAQCNLCSTFQGRQKWIAVFSDRCYSSNYSWHSLQKLLRSFMHIRSSRALNFSGHHIASVKVQS